MKKQIRLLATLLFVPGFFLVSCSTSQKYVAHKNSRQPKFMGDIYLSSHNKNSATSMAVSGKKPAKTETEVVSPANDNATPEPYYGSRERPNSYEPRVIGVTVTPPKNKEVAQSQVAPKGMEDVDSRSVSKKYAEKLGITPDNITNPSLYEFIEKWYGINYRLGGLDSTGIDCSAFAQKLYNEIYGIDLNRTAKEQFSNCARLKHSKEAKEGDLVFFHVHSRRITHVGVYLANDYFVHASSSQGVVISNLKDPYWHKYYASCGRIKRVEFAKN